MIGRKAVGVFDSGVGGLTVYRALRARLPHEDFIYLGDTARLPYGTKSPETVAAYGFQVAQRLMDEGIKILIVACNTASALALPYLQKALAPLPCLGVIEPGAAAAVAATRTGQIAVLATEGTIQSRAYHTAIAQRMPGARVYGLACNLLVGLAEEGWCSGPEAEAVIARYLVQLPLDEIDTLVLGCTHFPLLAPLFRALLPAHVSLVDSAATTARDVEAFMAERRLLAVGDSIGHSRFMVTDGAARFARLAGHFLPQAPLGDVEVVGLGPVLQDRMLTAC